MNQTREFLLYFEDLRKKNRKIDRPKNELLAYDTAIKNSNDQGSMSECYKIIDNELNIFLNNKNK